MAVKSHNLSDLFECQMDDDEKCRKFFKINKSEERFDCGEELSNDDWEDIRDYR